MPPKKTIEKQKKLKVQKKTLKRGTPYKPCELDVSVHDLRKTLNNEVGCVYNKNGVVTIHLGQKEFGGNMIDLYVECMWVQHYGLWKFTVTDKSDGNKILFRLSLEKRNRDTIQSKFLEPFTMFVDQEKKKGHGNNYNINEFIALTLVGHEYNYINDKKSERKLMHDLIKKLFGLCFPILRCYFKVKMVESKLLVIASRLDIENAFDIHKNDDEKAFEQYGFKYFQEIKGIKYYYSTVGKILEKVGVRNILNEKGCEI